MFLLHHFSPACRSYTVKFILILGALLLPILLLAQPKCPVPKARKPGGRLYVTAWATPNARLLPVVGGQGNGGGVATTRQMSWRADLNAGFGMGWWLQRDVAIQAGTVWSLATIDLRDAMGEGRYLQGLYMGVPLQLYFYPNPPAKQFKEINFLSVGLIPTFLQPINTNFNISQGFNSLHAEMSMGFSRKPTPYWEVRCETLFSYPLMPSEWSHTALVGFKMGIMRRSRTI